MAEINGQFPDVPTVDILGDEASESDLKRISALEQENRDLVHEKDVIEKRIVDLNQSIEQVNTEKVKLLDELHESISEVRILKSVAARAVELEDDVSKLQGELISTSSRLEEVNRELTDVKSTLDGITKMDDDKCKEFEAIVAERDLLVEKLGKLEAKEKEYLNEMNAKENDIGGLNVKVEELKAVAGKVGDDRLKRELEVKVGELERKLEDKERVVNGFEEMQRETVVVEGKRGEVNIGWPMIAGSAVCAIGFVGLVCYLHQAKRT